MESAPQNARKNQGRGNRRHLFSASIPSPPASAMDGWVRPRWMISRKGYAKAPKKNDFICFASKIIFSGAANNYPQVCTDNLENKKHPRKGVQVFFGRAREGFFLTLPLLHWHSSGFHADKKNPEQVFFGRMREGLSFPLLYWHSSSFHADKKNPEQVFFGRAREGLSFSKESPSRNSPSSSHRSTVSMMPPPRHTSPS